MDMEDYLSSTRLIHKTPAAAEPEWLVGHLLSSAGNYFSEDIGFRRKVARCQRSKHLPMGGFVAVGQRMIADTQIVISHV